MHRHGYATRKLGREKDQRRALIRGLATSLVEEGSIETTEAKAKEIRPYVEKLVTKGKKGTLHAKRQISSSVDTKEAAHRLVNEIPTQTKARTSGYLRIERTRMRVGDSSQMARISFVDNLDQPAPKAKPVPKKAEAKKENKKAETKPAKQTTSKKEDK